MLLTLGHLYYLFFLPEGYLQTHLETFPQVDHWFLSFPWDQNSSFSAICKFDQIRWTKRGKSSEFSAYVSHGQTKAVGIRETLPFVLDSKTSLLCRSKGSNLFQDYPYCCCLVTSLLDWRYCPHIIVKDISKST